MQDQSPEQADPLKAAANEATSPDTQAASETVDADPMASLAADLATAQGKVQELQDAFLRAKADAENIRRRSQEDISKAHKYGIENFAESLVPVMDSLNAALAVDIEITKRQLSAAFEKNRLLEIDPAGEKFDPHKHQAISMLPSETVAPGHIISVLQKGYLIAERVLRPALVVVSQ
jgi:molecular chaperone GrpE